MESYGSQKGGLISSTSIQLLMGTSSFLSTWELPP
ncbi:hypothetical protein LINPERPRIM_LOCUS36584 [Linum perenne]